MTETRRTARGLLVPGGPTRMGSTGFYAEEQPVVDVVVDDLLVDEHPVTNIEFRRFVKSTGHLTVAERAPDPSAFPDADADLLVPGSLVFVGTSRPVPLDDWQRWWAWVPGADWRHPSGPGSDLSGRDKHPVVHVGRDDARAYAAWAGKRLPTEPEWEHAARGGLTGRAYAWGDELEPDGRVLANTYQGDFPWRPASPRGATTTPVGSYAPNGHGLVDMIGNVWEWTGSPWTDSHAAAAPTPVSSCCAPSSAVSVEEERAVTKGGSHLCAPSYCRRYRPAARQGQAVLSSTSHVGFRCVRDA